MNELTLKVETSSDVASAIIDSVQPEISSNQHGRSSVDLSYDGVLNLRVNSSDLHALRAAVNTYLRWLDMSLKLTQED